MSSRGTVQARSRTAALIVVMGAALAGCSASTAAPSAAKEMGRHTPPRPSAPVAAPTDAAPSVASTTVTAVKGFTAVDLSFVSDRAGFALGTARCADQAARRLVLLGTTDGGHRWSLDSQLSAHTNTGDRGCPDSTGRTCVQHVRFVTPRVGYVFDPALYMTTDGGRSWTRQPGWTTSLEGNARDVLRVSSATEPCGGATSWLEISAPGSTSWQRIRSLRDRVCPPVLYRQGLNDIAIVDYGNPAGCCPQATIEVSQDRGRRVTSVPEPCTRGHDNSYTSAVALAPGSVLARVCTGGATHPYEGATWLRLSTDFGRTYAAQRPLAGDPQGRPPVAIAAASASRLIALLDGAHAGMLQLSTDGGQHWRTTGEMPPGTRMLIGFEDSQTARAAVGNELYTTTDGGNDWAVSEFTPTS